MSQAPNTVVVIGGGLSGLSAAHQALQVRFRVWPWRPKLGGARLFMSSRVPARGC